MTLTTRVLIAGIAGLMLLPAATGAQRLTLTLTPRVITFPPADPDVVPVVDAAPVEISYRVQQNIGGNWLLTVRADGDLLSGGATVDISNVTWIATPAPPFQNGTLSRTVEQTLASGSGNVIPADVGSLTFRLANSWNYTAGTYTQTVVFTLSAP
jgi:hypothetical protein